MIDFSFKALQIRSAEKKILKNNVNTQTKMDFNMLEGPYSWAQAGAKQINITKI